MLIDLQGEAQGLFNTDSVDVLGVLVRRSTGGPKGALVVDTWPVVRIGGVNVSRERS